MKKVISLLLVLTVAMTTLAGCNYAVATDEDGNINITTSPTGEAQDVTINVAMPTEGASFDSAMIPGSLESVYKISHNVDDILVPDRDYLITVNADNPYDFDGAYNKALQPDLVFTVNAVDGDVMAVEKATYLAFTMLQRELREADGINIQLYDGYRTAEDQKILQELNEAGDPNVTKANDPGYSEHHTGLLLDVVVWASEDVKDYEWCSASSERWEEMDEFKTILGKITDYGFIVRYPDDKADITGVEGKSFEIRFVGSKEIASEIMNNGLCLEEYLAQYSESNDE